MMRLFAAAVGVFTLSLPVAAEVQPYPAEFRTEDIATDGATIHVRVGGKGPAVLLLHGFGDTGDMWAPLAKELVQNHTVIAPDLRGMGLSSQPAGGYDKKTEARDIAMVLDHLKVDQADARHPRHRQHGRLRVCRAVSRIASRVGSRWMRRCPASATGRRSSSLRRCGISIFADPTSSAS